MARLTVIESNLCGENGHYAEFVRALASCMTGGDRLRVMCDEALPDSVLADLAGVTVERRFRTVERQRDERQALQECLAAGDPFLILTAHHTDVLRLEGASRATGIAPDHARLYFHWQERGFLERLAVAACTRVRRHACAVAPTEAIAAFLRGTGWRHVECIAYPVRAVPRNTTACGFRHLLVAGSVRMNKGIDKVVDSLPYLTSRSPNPPLLVQTTGKRRGGVSGRAESRAVSELLASRYPALRTDPHAPDPSSYADRFRGAITLTPYDPANFAHNVSGIALDALLHGSPVVATRGTWQAALVERFGAGRVMSAWTGRCLASAAMECIDDWDRVSTAARHAASELALEHNPDRLLRRLMGVS
jgi:hypothetical protein